MHESQDISNNPSGASRVLEICRAMSAERDLGALLSLLAREAARLLDAERASIFLLDTERCELWSRVALGTSEELRFDARLGIAGEVALNGETVIVDKVYDDPRFNPAIDARLGYRTRSILAVPLRDRQGECVGVFEVLNKTSGAFSSQDATLLEELAHHAAAATETALLVEDLQLQKESLLQENRNLLREVRDQFSTTRQIFGTSRPIQQLIRQIEEICSTPVDVLVTGESGTGKELVAKAIHFSGDRSAKPFVALNCSALPENLVEAELFGIEKGVATGVDRRLGKFECANGGTLFLDEVGDLSVTAQAKILRVLQERLLERVGGRQPIPLDVRIIAATHRDLAAEVRNQSFREDLFFRLNVIRIQTPALREIPEDLPLLASHFMAKHCQEAGKRNKQFSPEALHAMALYRWPGNVRELENEMKRLAVTLRRETVQPADLSPAIRDSADSACLKDAVEELEKSFIRRALDRSKGNRVQAAQLLGLSRQGLLKKMSRYGLR